MFDDPTLLPVEEKKTLGVWETVTFAESIYPYLKRMKHKSVRILDVNCSLGETAYRLLELDKNINKIKEIHCLPQDPTNETLIKNIEDSKKYVSLGGAQIVTEVSGPYDLVFLNALSCPKDKLVSLLARIYKEVNPSGIFAGNEHRTTEVKEALGEFRRSNKIGTPIMIANKDYWFWYKR